jgi:polyketide synthase PksN
VTALRSLQPNGPYSLLGHSYGGVVAYEMTRTLLEQGEEVSSLILLDSIIPAERAHDGASDERDELVEACLTLARLYEIDLPLDAERLRPLSVDEQVEHLHGLLAARGVEIDRDQFVSFYGVYRANLRCYRAYVPSALPREVNASLYLATRRNGDSAVVPPDGGWNQHLLSPIRRHDVDADHFSILKHVVFETFAPLSQISH